MQNDQVAAEAAECAGPEQETESVPSVLESDYDSGPWRDRKALVVRRNRVRLGERCLATGSSQEVVDCPIKWLKFPKPIVGLTLVAFVAIVIDLLFGRLVADAFGVNAPLLLLLAALVVCVVGVGLTWLLTEVVVLEVPLSLTTEPRVANRRILYALLVSVILVPIVAMLVIAGLSSVRGMQWLTDLLSYTAGVFLILSLVCAIGVSVRNFVVARQSVSIMKVRGNYAWLRGVDPDLLTELHEWYDLPEWYSE